MLILEKDKTIKEGHKHTIKICSLTRRLYRVVASGSHHTEMWRDKFGILKSVPINYECFLNLTGCYLRAPCAGPGCRGGCPCGREAGSPGSPSTGMVTAGTRRDSENHYYYYYNCQSGSGRRCYRIPCLSLHLQTRFDLPGTQFEFEVDAGDYSQ